MNPLLNNLGNAQRLMQVMQMAKANPQQMANQIMQNNPDFAKKINATNPNDLKGLAMQELQRQGIDINTLRSMGVPI